MTVSIWITIGLAVASGVLSALISAVWLLSGISKDVERMKDDIGTSESGMRYRGVQNSIALTALLSDVTSLTKRFDALQDWKHKVGDAYLPRAVEEHERRLNRIEAKVYNGHRT